MVDYLVEEVDVLDSDFPQGASLQVELVQEKRCTLLEDKTLFDAVEVVVLLSEESLASEAVQRDFFCGPFRSKHFIELDDVFEELLIFDVVDVQTNEVNWLSERFFGDHRGD